MRKFIIFSILAITLSACGYDTLAIEGQSALTNQNGPQRYIVSFDGQADETAVTNHGGQVLNKLNLVNGLAVLLPDHAAASKVRAEKGVKLVEEDALVYSSAKPAPAPQPAQIVAWGVSRIGANAAWAVNNKGAGVKVAILDTGIDKNHLDLAANIKGGVNFVSSNPAKPADPNKWDDDNGHGTHVAGIVAAQDNAIGTVGVAPEAQLYAVKVLNRNGSGYVSGIIAGLDWAVENGMQVVNMSLGTNTDMQALHNAVDAASAAGVLLVAAAGNDGDGDPTTNNVDYPAKYSSVIAVGATASDDSVPAWSSDGAEVEVSAPGAGVLSTWNDGYYKSISGTSMASPHAAGTLALMLASGALPADARALLQTTAEDLGAPGLDVFYGYGLADAEKAVGL